jgi:hypothetical protein
MKTTQPTSVRDLKSLFCEHFRCPPDEFEKRILRKCLYFPANILAPLLRLMDDEWFKRDLLFVRDLGKAADWKQIMAELDAFRFRENLHPGFARNNLRLRVSARKANKLAFDLFPS